MLHHITRVAFIASCLAFVPLAAAQETAPASNVDLTAALSQVRWQGAPPTLDMVKDKSSIVFVYATWCPKCNEWSGELMQQVKAAAVEQPVTVFAINADATSPGAGYAVERGLVGPNIIHGSDARIPARLGLNSELFKFVAFDPAGKMIERGEGGSFYPRANGKDYVLAKKLNDGAFPGEFAVLSKEMSPQLKQLLWPVELGQPINDKSLIRLRGQVPADQQDDFNTAIRDYLAKALAKCEEGAAGDVPQQIAAYPQAKQLAERFASTSQGKKARTIVTKLDEDPQFKKEVSAATAYQKALASGTPAAAKRALIKVANRFEGTHFGKLASEQAAAQ